MGKHKGSALGTLVERYIRYTILLSLGNQKDALNVRKAGIQASSRLAKKFDL